MAADSSKSLPLDRDALARRALIRRCGFDDETVAEIAALQERQGVSFGEAAIRLGYAVREDVAAIGETLRMPSASVSKPTPGTALVIARAPYHERSEQIRSLRTELMLRLEDASAARMLAVLSPCAGEGRSQLAADLSIAFAQLGRPTLLVDADMRHPRQHVLFEIDNSRGLSQALTVERRPRLHSVPSLPLLSLLTSGDTPRNSLELLSRPFFESLVEEWRQRFDFVIFDTPPVSRYADGLAVATVVGHSLALSRAQRTPYKEMRNLLRRLASTHSQVHGAVINHF